MIDIQQGWVATGGDAHKHIAALMGDVFVVGWIFGQVVSMEGAALSRPSATGAALAFPTMDGVTLEV